MAEIGPADPDEIPHGLENHYNPDEVFCFEGTPEDMADTLFRERN